MDKEFIQDMQQQLEDEHALVMEELDTISAPDVGDHVPGERAAKFPNYGDDALGEDTESPAEVSEYSLNVNVTGALETRLTNIKAALARIADGSYGICEDCAKPIGADRLRANPSSALCIDCASKRAL